ncbi:hypothetical protein Tco_1404238 [Tanacetum coccineum]
MVDAYFQKIESITTLLNALGSPLSSDIVVTYAINGLSEMFSHVARIIAHRDPFLDLTTVRSMVTTEELCLNSKSQTLSENTSFSASTVPLVGNPNSRSQDNCDTHFTQRPCNNFSRGFYRLPQLLFLYGPKQFPQASFQRFDIVLTAYSTALLECDISSLQQEDVLVSREICAYAQL